MNIWAKCQRIYVLYRISLKQQNLLLSKIPLHDDTLTEHKVTCNHTHSRLHIAATTHCYNTRSKRMNWIQALFLGTFSVVFRTLLHGSTMSQTIPDIHGSSQIFPVSEGMSFQRFVFSKKGTFDFLGFLRGWALRARPESQESPLLSKTNL